MNLHHFFSGKMSREEVSSAFLATLLEQDKAFRTFFLEKLELSKEHCEEDWTVTVEAENVDIRLDSRSSSSVIIVENKLSAGARQKEQLLGYYRAAIKADPSKSIVAAYLAPEGMGGSELKRVWESKDFKDRLERDKCCGIAWETLITEFTKDQINCTEFVSSGFKEILARIKADRETIYPEVGDRLRLTKLIGEVFMPLQKKLPNLRWWKTGDRQNLYTEKAKLTVYLEVRFPIDDSPEYQPKVFFPGGRVKLQLETSFQISGGRGRRDPELKRQWHTLCSSGEGHVFEEHKLTGKWFKRVMDLEGSETEVKERLQAECENVLSRLDKAFPGAIVSTSTDA